MKKIIPLFILIITGFNCLSQSFSSLSVFISEDESGKPVSSAEIKIKEAAWTSKIAGSDGKVFFDKSMPIGEIHFVVSKEGYQRFEGAFNITTEEKSNSLNIKLSKIQPSEDKVFIVGEINDGYGNDVAGVSIEVRAADKIIYGYSDQSGNYLIEINLSAIKFALDSFLIEIKKDNCKIKKKVALTTKKYYSVDANLVCGNSSDKFNKGDLIGIWKAELYENGLLQTQISEFMQNGVLKTTFLVNNTYSRTTYSEWDYVDQELLQKYESGGRGRGKIEWVNKDTMILTIVDNGAISNRGNKRHFNRIK